MNILYIGSGFVGACSAAVSADSGHRVLAYDVDSEKIKNLNSGDLKKIESSLFEEGLAEMIIRNQERIDFTDDYQKVIDFLPESDVVFMCLPTPEKKDGPGETDLTFYIQACEKLATVLKQRNNGQQEKYVVVVNKSTVPINMVDQTESLLKSAGVENFGVVSNPEFLAEGKAMIGSASPERVVVGAKTEKEFEVMRQVYQRFVDLPAVEFIEVSPQEAAAGKLLANYLLFNKVVTTFEVVGRLSEIFPEINFENLRKILTSDSRIGSWGFYNSVYAGGSCWIKDASSLAHQIEQVGSSADIIRKTLTTNNFQRDNFYDRIKNFGGLKDKSVAILGLAFKQDTNDVRNSPAVEFVNYLLSDDVKEIKVYDPQAMEMFKKVAVGKRIEYCQSEEQALVNSDICIILTDWPQFKALSEKIKEVCPPPYLIADGRRMLSVDYDELGKMGYNIIAVGEKNI